MITRRQFVQKGAIAATASSLLAQIPLRAQTAVVPTGPNVPSAHPSVDYRPVITPNNAKLPWKFVDGVKVFHLIAEEVEHQFAPGLTVKCWGYNGSVHGPTIEAVEGDRVRFYVTNRLTEPTTVHWHGIRLPNGMDGVGGLTQKLIQPGETFKYEFPLIQHGTFMYHPHYDEMTQMALGMMGLFIIHPRANANAPDRDFAIMLSEWKIAPGASRPDPLEMTDFNILTLNGVVYPACEPLVVKQGERVRIRLGNLGAMEHHPIHLHGYSFRIVESGGARVPESAQYFDDTILVPVGSTRAFEFIADAPGDWALHCHMTHHTMNQMSHDASNDDKIHSMGSMKMDHDGMGAMPGMDMNMKMDMPKNDISMMGGPGPFDNIEMGGMFTVLKVRPDLTSYDDPGWYRHPEGTVAIPATVDELRRDGIDKG